MPDLLTNHAPEVTITGADGSCAAIHRHGGHVVSWRTGDGEEQLFVSPLARLGPDTAIRGGVPVIFPQFSDLGPLPKHGFARTAPWSVESQQIGRATMQLTDSEATRSLWPHAFALDLAIELTADRLTLRLTVENSGDGPFSFTGALHTYLRVADVADATVVGLRGVTVRDQAEGGRETVEQSDSIRFGGEVDRAYLSVPGSVELSDGERQMSVEQTGFTDVVVWNPGAEKAAAMADLGAEAARRFVCIEAALVGQSVTLSPGERWSGTQTVTRRRATGVS